MSIYKRRGSRNYWLKITIPGQPPVQRSTGTTNRREAKEYHDQLKAQLWRQAKLGEKRSYLWEEAVLRFLQETSHKRDHHGDRSRLRWLHPYLEGYPLESVSRELLDHIMHQKSGKAPGTINRYLATVRSILRKAHREWGWLDMVPAIRMRQEPKQRIRWITREEAAQLLAALPSHLADAAELTLNTGLRQSNVLSLTWRQVDMARHTAWIYADEAKAKKDLAVPLNANALAVIRRRLGTHPTHVISYAGKALKHVNAETWQKACQKADIRDFRWHDLRHTWASWHVQAGTGLQELMELGGWSSYQMVLRYAHLGSAHLHRAADNLSTIQLQSNVVAFVGQTKK